MPPHLPWRPAATERRLSLVRRSSSLLVRRSARSYLSLPGMVGKSSRSERFSDHQGLEVLGFTTGWTQSEAPKCRERIRSCRKSPKRKKEGGAPPRCRHKCRSERPGYFFVGLNIPAATRVTKRRGTRRSPCAPK